MAVDKKISQLTSLVQGDVDAALDVLPIVDTGADETKKITVTALVGAGASAGLSSVDINGGTIDGTTIGASSAAAGTFTTVGATTGNITTVNATTVDATNVEVTNIKAKDGTAAASIADSTGIVSITANPILSGGTANGVLYLNGSKVATSGSALTFNGSLLTATSGSFNGNATPASGESVEVTYASNAGFVTTFNRTSSAYTDLNLRSLNMRFSTGGGETMRLDSSGNLGIGTTSPDAGAKLTAFGGILATGSFSSTSGSSGGIDYNSGNLRFFAMGSSGSTKGGYIWIAKGADNSSSTPMTLDSSGNLGLGVTPSAWNASYKAFQVGAASLNNGANNRAELSWNFYRTTAPGDAYIISDYATKYTQTTGQHIWYTAPSGTAGNAITFTQAMTLTASSELNIDSGTGGGRLTFTPGNTSNAILSTTTGFGAYNILRYYGTQHQWFNPSTQAMTLDASGNLGIGTTSPLDRLDVVSGSSTNRNRVRNSTSDEAFFLFQNSTTGTTTSSGLAVGIDSSENAYLYNYINSPLIFATNATERARITAGGYFKASNTGTYESSTGTFHELRSDDADDAVVAVDATNASYTGPVFFVGAARNTTNNSFYAINYYNRGAAAYKFRVADSGAIATAGGIALGTDTPATSGVGVQFPATQSASSNANTLDDYEEGNWTGTLKGSTTDPTTPVTATGKYTKIGRQVTVAIYFENVNTTGAAGSVSITGLPFTEDGTRAVGTVATYLFDFPAGVTSLWADFSGTTAGIYASGDNVAWADLQHSAGAGRYLRMTGTYFV